MENTREQQPIGVCMIVMDESKKKILLGLRKNSYKSGNYGFPGGRVEVGEKLEHAMMREMKEETGLIAEEKDIHYVGVVKENQGELDFIHFIFTCNKVQGELQTLEPEKCEGWEWLNIENLPQNILSGHKAGLELLLSKQNLIEI